MRCKGGYCPIINKNELKTNCQSRRIRKRISLLLCTSAKINVIQPVKSVYISYCEIKYSMYTLYVQTKHEPRRI